MSRLYVREQSLRQDVLRCEWTQIEFERIIGEMGFFNPFRQIYLELAMIRRTQGQFVAAFDDLNTAVAALQAGVAAIGTQMDALSAAIAAAGNPPAVAAAAAAIQQQVADLAAIATRNPIP